MRKFLSEVMEAGRITHGAYGSNSSLGMAGGFRVVAPSGEPLIVMSSGQDYTGWEHVSVSCEFRTPTWQEMCFIKDQFWDENEMVVQYHPPKSEYVNCHPYCLHMWKATHMSMPMPPSLLVGPKNAKVIKVEP